MTSHDFTSKRCHIYSSPNESDRKGTAFLAYMQQKIAESSIFSAIFCDLLIFTYPI
jgi:hypothetical protein